ncbi:MAG TPA: hypothetical protein VJI15_04285 [Candidatus Nanoarchaeia archaeon]|nr:hypothetical protein [Candidatus Nanoarchaeia archaeon]
MSNTKGQFLLDKLGSLTFWLIVLAILMIILGIYLAPKLLDLANSSVNLW